MVEVKGSFITHGLSKHGVLLHARVDGGGAQPATCGVADHVCIPVLYTGKQSYRGNSRVRG